MRTALLLVLAAAVSASADEPCPPPKPPPACPPAAPVAPAPAPAQPQAPPASPAVAEKPAQDEAAVRARSTAVRAALPAPMKPWSFERDLVFDGFLLGKVTILAEPATLDDKPVWYVVEKTVREAGEGRVVNESSCFLAQDLSLIRGETILRSPGGTEATSFGRRDGKMEVVVEVGGKAQSAEADVPADATLGLFPVIQFVEAAWRPDAKPAAVRHHLGVFDPRHAFGDGEGKPIPAGAADLALELASGVEIRSVVTRTLLEVSTKSRSGRGSVFLVSDGRVLASNGRFPHWDLGATGVVTRKPDWFARVGQTPQTAYQAFCNFGRGYHLAKRELIDSAFDWTSVHAHDLAAGSIKTDMTVEQLREAYIAEFMKMSKHRTAADCDDLLTQILVTSEITKDDKLKTVSIKALPVYGGHTFHCAEKDGRWWISHLD